MKDIITTQNLEKLQAIDNLYVTQKIMNAVALLKPSKVTILTDSLEDQDYIRKLAIKNGEEHKLDLEGHTYHFDSIFDQARDKENTKYLLDEKVDWGLDINWTYRDDGMKEINQLMSGIMKGKEMFVAFYCLGPNDSPFSIPSLQITDSAYVIHSENILYRQGYNDFKNLGEKDDFFFLIHSSGELENGVSKNIDKRRIYIDINNNCVYTCNNQYAGNSLGLKKLCFRLAIKKAMNEDWLAEHMFLMGLHGRKDRVSYVAGAFPSGCGKTSTAMITGESIVGDDIAYIRNIDGKPRAVNVEQGIFGIINDINPTSDPEIFKALTTKREVIFSNTLISNGKSYWHKMGVDLPEKGINHTGKWDKDMSQIPSSKNARYTMHISELSNADKNLNNKNGVLLDAMIFGGRDAYTTVPVVEATSWKHGILLGSIIESETTMASIGKEGKRTHDPLATCDFISVPFNQFITKHLEFGETLTHVPKIYATNYFLKDNNGDFLNDKLDKKVWLAWIEKRINKELTAIKTPIGYIPYYDDLKVLFKEKLNKEYSMEEYTNQFSIRIDKYLEKMERMKESFKDCNLSDDFKKEFNKELSHLEKAKKDYGISVIKPYMILEKIIKLTIK